MRGQPPPVKIWGQQVGFGQLKSFGQQLQGADGDFRLFIVLLGGRTRKNESDKKTKEERKKPKLEITSAAESAASTM